MKIDIDIEIVDGIVLAALRLRLKWLRNPKYPSKHPEDIAYEKKLAAALKMLIKYYGG